MESNSGHGWDESDDNIDLELLRDGLSDQLIKRITNKRQLDDNVVLKYFI